MIAVDDILTTAATRKLCGIDRNDRHTLLRWRRTRNFPEPIKVFKQRGGQRLELFDRKAVKAWLKANPPISERTP